METNIKPNVLLLTDDGRIRKRINGGVLRVFTPSLTPIASSLVANISLTCLAAVGVTDNGARNALLLGFVASFAALFASFFAADTTTLPAILLSAVVLFCILLVTYSILFSPFFAHR
jgi:hypothetical protein